MLKKIRNPTIHVGDKVQIINHEYFLRVGFPMRYHEDVMENPEMREVIDGQILELLSNPAFPWYSTTGNCSIGDGLIRRGLGFCILKAKNFGGNERKIYTNTESPMTGKFYTVIEKKIVRTGIFQHGRIKGINNVILNIKDEKTTWTRWIEAKNVRLLKDCELVLM